MICATDKFPETVGRIFVKACNRFGWARRVRWDKGKEARVAMEAQLRKWKDFHNRTGTVLNGGAGVGGGGVR